jgi:hypothetical protein
MSRSKNASASATIEVTVSAQSRGLLEQLAGHGIYGRNVADVAGRFVDAALERFIEAPKLKLTPLKKAGVR